MVDSLLLMVFHNSFLVMALIPLIVSNDHFIGNWVGINQDHD